MWGLMPEDSKMRDGMSIHSVTKRITKELIESCHGYLFERKDVKECRNSDE